MNNQIPIQHENINHSDGINNSGVKEPFPINLVANRYLVYDVKVVSHLREKWHMCGCLIGSLPQIPQQNVFLGIPLELMVEEAALLVECGAAFVLDDVIAHKDALKAMQEADKQKYFSQIKEEEDALAWTALAASNTRKVNAMDKIKKGKQIASKKDENESVVEGGQKESAVPVSSLPIVDEDAEESLFGDDGGKQSIKKGISKHLELEQISDDTQPPANAGTPILPSNAARFHITLATSNSLPSYTSAVFSPTVPSTTTHTHTPQPDPARYHIYKYLHAQGYYLSPGLRFGCQFLAYPGDPLRFHSHFLVNGFEWDDKVSMISLVGGGRLGTGVKKSWMFGGKERDEEEQDDANKDGMRSFCVEWAGFG